MKQKTQQAFPREQAAQLAIRLLVRSSATQRLTSNVVPLDSMRTFADRALTFYETLPTPGGLPPQISVMNPFGEPAVRECVTRFLQRYFGDQRPRILVFGINPGRFGAGVTGVTFTDPVALKTACGIDNQLPPRRELSSQFVYSFIDSWGGPDKFYKDFFLTAACPLGFLRGGVNYNYYDDQVLLRAVRPFIVATIRQQIELGSRTTAAIVFGTGKNRKILDEINQEYRFFDRLHAVEHPRFIMQYRRRQLDHYIHKYKDVFLQALH